MNDPVLGKVSELVSDIEDELGEAASVVTRAVVVCEFIDSDGDRCLRIIRDRFLKSWEMRGLLAEVLSDMEAFDVVVALEDGA